MHLIAATNPIAFELLPFGTAVAVFVIFYLIFRYKIWPGIAKGLDERNAKIISEIKAAEQARHAAKARQDELEAKMREALEQADRMIREAKAEALRAGQEIRAKNEAELAERIKRASDEIEAARRAAVADIQAQASDLGVSIARRILGRTINADDQKKLVEESLREYVGTGRN